MRTAADTASARGRIAGMGPPGACSVPPGTGGPAPARSARIWRMQPPPPARRLPWYIHVALVALIVALPFVTKGPTVAAPGPPVELTAQQDHERLLRLMGITSLRRGPSGD